MPIVSISKIQHRYGLSDNGPSNSSNLQLSAAELGWELDTRKLFIGNGPISEGAPEIGNTEILTEHTNIIAIDDLYKYAAEITGYSHATTSRSLQNKLDEYVSVRDYGAIGDGTTNDGPAINAALIELFANTNQSSYVRRSLFFPAGTYRTEETITIPPYAKLVGEGKNSSVVIYEGPNTSDATVITVDTQGQVGANIGTNGARAPQYIEVNDMSFERSNTNGSVLEITAAQNCTFRRVSFVGNASTTPVTPGTHDSCLKIFSTGAIISSNIVFEGCDFKKNAYGINIEDNLNSIVFNGCVFDTLWKGAKIGETIVGTGPRHINILNSYFDNIYKSGIHVYNIPSVSSAYNYFKDVGNHIQGSGNPEVEVIVFENSGNTSLNDVFDRNDTDAGVYSRVSANTYQTYVLDVNDSVYFGYHKQGPGKVITLANNSTAASTGLTFDSTDEKSTLIYYTATKGANQRHGMLRITGANITDEYNETSDIELSFAVVDDTTNITLNYTLAAGTDVTFKYRVERLL